MRDLARLGRDGRDRDAHADRPGHGNSGCSRRRTSGPDVQAHWFADDGTFPNNEVLPALVVWRGLRDDVEHGARAFERLFRRHDRRRVWGNGIYPHHHLHSTAHEVLGAARASLYGAVGPLLDHWGAEW